MSAEKGIPFGQFVREMRELRGKERGQPFTPGELSRELGVGDKPSSVVSRIESGNQYLSGEGYERVGEVLGFSMAEGPYSENRVRANAPKLNEIVEKDSFGAFLRALRTERGYTQQELVAISGVSDISSIEHGKGMEGYTLLKLMDVLVFTPEYLGEIATGRRGKTPERDSFGAQLREERIRRGWSQKDLGKLLGYTSPVQMMNLLEQNKMNPPKHILEKLFILLAHSDGESPHDVENPR